MAELTKERIIEELKSSTQNASGMFEISEDTICNLMSMLTNAAPQLPQPAQDYFSSLVSSARVRADKAMRKFPQPNYVLNKVAEESGEVIKAVIHYTEGREEWANVEGEIVDNLAMLIRLVTEGDQVIGFTPPESCRAAMLQGAEPVSQSNALPKEINCKQAYCMMHSNSLAGCYRDGWNDCRTVMLEAAPQQEVKK